MFKRGKKKFENFSGPTPSYFLYIFMEKQNNGNKWTQNLLNSPQTRNNQTEKKITGPAHNHSIFCF